MQVRFNSTMTCDIYQHNHDTSTDQGRYIDLRKNPELAADLPEAKAWPALGMLLESINRTDAFRTTGCTAPGMWSGGHDAAFVDVAFDDDWLGRSRQAHKHLQNELIKLDGNPAGGEMILELVDASAKLPDGTKLLSTRFWFLGTKQQAEESFAPIVSLLRDQRAAVYKTTPGIRPIPGFCLINVLILAAIAVAIWWFFFRG